MKKIIPPIIFLVIFIVGLYYFKNLEASKNPINKSTMTNNEKVNTEQTSDNDEDNKTASKDNLENKEIEEKDDNQESEIKINDKLLNQYNKALISTNKGDIKVKLYNDLSPLTVSNFLSLSRDGFYDNTKFHRVMNDFMIQGGDPNSKDDDWSNDGQGGPGYQFEDEFNDKPLVEGSLAMANSGPNTNGSQFFIVTKESTPWLDGVHTNFGEVIEGMDVVKEIEQVKVNEKSHPTEDVIIKNINLIEK